MRKIAIFTLGEGLPAQRVISLFNEGNRIRVALVVADSEEDASRFKALDSSLSVFTSDDWKNNPQIIIEALKGLEVEKIALDKWAPEEVVIAEEPFFDNVDTFIISSEEESPREVVAAFKEKLQPAPEKSHSELPSVDEEWARTLKVEFDEETARQVPPPIPGATPSPQSTAQPAGRPSAALNTTSNPANPSQSNIPNPEQMPKSYLVWSILTTVFCCLVPGIVAIIFSSQVSSKYYSGDLEGAKRASRNAEIWIIVSFVLGVLSATLYLPIALIN